MKRRVLFLVLLLLPCAVLFAQEKKTIAVYVAGNEEETVKKVFASKVVSAIIGQGKYMAVERTSSFLEQIGKETSYQGSGAVSESQLSKIGQQFGASYVCAIDISVLYGERFITAKFINTETAIVEVNEDISGNWNDLKGLESVAKGLAAKLVGEQKTYNDPNGPRQIQINYQDYEVLPGDLEGTYTWENAKSACANITAFGKSGWYLPTKAELNALYKRKDEIGGFTGGIYWSSSDSGQGAAWGQRFSDGGKYSAYKNGDAWVRCVRKY